MKPSSNFLPATIRAAPVLALLLASAGCAVGPNYKRPAAAVPPAFKEQPPPNFKEAEAAGWKQSQPGDAYSKGRWWELYNDAALNALEEQVGVSNQNVLQAEAQYREARAEVCVARAALFPVASTSPSITAAGSGAAPQEARMEHPDLENPHREQLAAPASICHSTFPGSRTSGATFAAV